MIFYLNQIVLLQLMTHLENRQENINKLIHDHEQIQNIYSNNFTLIENKSFRSRISMNSWILIRILIPLFFLSK